MGVLTMKPTIVILAAGIGSRYGSLKQIDQVGPSGETIIDYSVYDALRAGFGKVIFVIRKSIEQEFKESLLRRWDKRADVDYVFQELEDIPVGFRVPAHRQKPWGTSHAVLIAEPKVSCPFAVINADDFYGAGAFRVMAGFLLSVKSNETAYSLVGYHLSSTLSEHGSVARGVCQADDHGMLVDIVERVHIEKTPRGIFFKDEKAQFMPLRGDETVSMNFWGFTPTFFGFIELAFENFLKENLKNPKAEIFIPLVINNLVKTGQVTVKVLDTNEIWFGVTYREDKPRVKEELTKLVAAGVYPNNLWA
jgi:NDP-sugar pyrophosphorylase family protein